MKSMPRVPRMKAAFVLMASVALAAVVGVPAHAADAAAQEASAKKEDKSYLLDSVKVFANKREQNAQDTPIAMTIIDGEKLEDAGIETLQDVFNRIPNLYSGSTVGNNQFMSFRGKATMGFVEANPLIVYVDGVPLDSFLNTDPSLLNVERIEVLRGSQSVMYGKSSMGGVINIISKKPTNEHRYNAYTSVGTNWTREVGGLASGPIVEDRFFYTLSAQYDGNEGFMRNNRSNESNSKDTGRVKGQLRFTPSERLEMNFMTEFMAEYKGMEPMIKGNHATLSSVLNPDDRTISNALSSAFSLGYDMDWSRFESVTTFHNDAVDYTQDLTYLGLGLTDSGRKVQKTEYTQEFRLKSPDSEKGMSWLMGVYGSYKDHDRKKVYSYFPAFLMYTNSPNVEKTKDFAMFGQMGIPLWDESLELSPALRFQYTDKSIDFKHSTVIAGVVTPGNREHTSDHWTAVLPRLTLSKRFTDEFMTYASVAKGYQPGGFNWSSSKTNPKDHTFDEQTSWDYELGLKSDLFGKRLTVNANVFYSDIKDLQTITYEAVSMSYLTDNAGKAYSLGGELDITARLAQGLDLELSAAFTRAKFAEYAGVSAAGNFDYAGNRVPLTPEHTLSAALQYRHETGVFLRGEVLHYGKMYWDDANTSTRNNMTIANAKVGYELENWKAYVYGNNVFDERYMTYYTAASDMGSVGAPSAFGFRVEASF